MTWWHIYIFTFISGAVVSLIMTPIFMRLAVRLGFYDLPRGQEHKKHSAPTPLLGGLSMFVSWAICIFCGVLIVRSGMLGKIDKDIFGRLEGVLAVRWNLFWIVFAGFLGVMLGLYDDKWNMSARTKLCGQISIALIAVLLGNVKVSLFLPYWWLSVAVSVLWIVGIMNAVNFFDNMDGLAAGVAAISFSLFAICAASSGQYFVASFAALTAGVTVGFWFYNHSPAQIFMGDSGSHFLGYLMAVMGVLVTYYVPMQSFTKFSVLIPLFILAIPIFDLFAVVVIRLRAGKPVYIGDHNHISHRFVAMGMSRKDAVLMVHLLSLIIGMSVLPVLWGDERTVIVCCVQALTILCLVTLLQIAAKKS